MAKAKVYTKRQELAYGLVVLIIVGFVFVVRACT